MPSPSPLELAAQERCDRILAGLRAARYGGWKMPDHDADAPVVHQALLDMRQRMDDTARLMTELRRFRAEARSQARLAATTADEAYDTALEKLSGRAVTREFESIKDREVIARMKTLKERRQANLMHRLADIMDAAWDEAQALFFSMRDVRGELIVTLDHYLPWLKSTEV
jgi:hypothetical protein